MREKCGRVAVPLTVPA